MESVLFVCRANVCRSPVLEYVFGQTLRARSDVSSTSAGTKAAAGRPICDFSRRALESRAGGDFSERHRAVRVEPALLASQSLVLVTSRAERGTIATLAPEYRKKLFTVREALALSRLPLSAEEQRQAHENPRPWDALAQILDARRGLLNLERREGRFPWRANRNLVDISDAHHHGSFQHAKTVAHVCRTATELAESSLALINAFGASPAGDH